MKNKFFLFLIISLFINHSHSFPGQSLVQETQENLQNVPAKINKFHSPLEDLEYVRDKKINAAPKEKHKEIRSKFASVETGQRNFFEDAIKCWALATSGTDNFKLLTAEFYKSDRILRQAVEKTALKDMPPSKQLTVIATFCEPNTRKEIVRLHIDKIDKTDTNEPFQPIEDFLAEAISDMFNAQKQNAQQYFLTHPEEAETAMILLVSHKERLKKKAQEKQEAVISDVLKSAESKLKSPDKNPSSK